MQIMLDELMAHEYTIPFELIIKCKELIQLEKAEIQSAYTDGVISGIENPSITAKQYWEDIRPNIRK